MLEKNSHVQGEHANSTQITVKLYKYNDYSRFFLLYISQIGEDTTIERTHSS